MSGSTFKEADEVQARFRGSKVDQERKGTILVGTVGPACRERGTVELLAKLTRTQGNEEVPSSLPLMAYRSGRE